MLPNNCIFNGMKKWAYLLTILLLFFAGCSSQQKTTIQYKKEDGVKPKKLSLDIYNNQPGRDKPVVVFVHGGGWILGDKATKIKRKVALFKELDYIFVSANYRLSSFFNKKVQYPKHTIDVADAIKWIFDSIDSYGGDKNKIVLLGHSAGAQMISLLVTSHKFLPERGISFDSFKGAISMDTEGYDVYGMCNAGAKIYQRNFGDDPEKWKEASPILQLKPIGHYPDFLIVMRGKPYRIEMANDFAAKLRASDTKVKLINADPYGHFKVNNILGAKKDTIVTPAVVKFLKSHFN